MIRERKIDLICLVSIGLAVLIAAGLMAGTFLFAPEEKTDPKKIRRNTELSTEYAEMLFDDSYVHEIDIQISEANWKSMVKFAEKEQYVLCTAVIDGEEIKNAAIRPKGNSSLSAIKSQDSDRFSFKIEFDHYKKNHTYHGLDKLALNNLGQDVSCMKDYLTYHMMNEAGIAAPLSSYVHMKLNGEDFGLYLAVEGIEDSFALRNYGEDFGNLYKPESFRIDTVTLGNFLSIKGSPYGEDNPFEKDYSILEPGDRVDILGSVVRGPFEACFGDLMEPAALKYVGEEADKYKVFWDSAVFDITEEDQRSLIHALKKLNSSDHPQAAMDVDSVIPYFVVHNFMNNYDGYTGVFVHNYYLREKDGVLSMIPWDYNLDCGIFTFESAVKSIMGEDSPYQVELKVGNAMDDKTSMVNYPIDTPTFTVDVEDRPLLSAVLKNEQYLKQYHETFQAFLDQYFHTGKFEEVYQRAWDNIAPYVKADQTFYTYEQFRKASDAVHLYCVLREKSIQRQLDGILPATMEGQRRDYRNLVDASYVDLASSVTFDSLVLGIRSQDIIEILDAIAGEKTHNSDGVTEVIAEAAEEPSAIVGIIGRVISSSRILKKAILSAIKGPALFLLSVLGLVISIKRIKKYEQSKQ